MNACYVAAPFLVSVLPFVIRSAAKDLALPARHRAQVLLEQLIGTAVSKSEWMQNLESRAKKARCIWTLTFILALTGRGDRKSEQLREIVIMARSTLGPHISILIGEKQGNNTAWQAALLVILT